MTKIAFGGFPKCAATLAVALVATLMACAPQGTERQDGAAAPLPAVELDERPMIAAHLGQADLAAGTATFADVFAAGRTLFHTAFNGLDGVGVAQLPNGTPIHRFALVPLGSTLLPPSGQSCGGCHNMPFRGAAGVAQTHVINDPDQDGEGPFNHRSTTSVFGDGLLQRLAEEITEELQAIRDEAAEGARQTPGARVSRELGSKGVSYGTIGATADASGEVVFDLSGLQGVDPDLVIRPIGWKGTVPTVRLLVFAAASIAMGMQADEFVWRLPGGEQGGDLDGDGVTGELSVGDITAMTVYTAGLSTPQELEALADAGVIEAPSTADLERVERGREIFADIGCASCHVPEMRLTSTVFEEPTARGNGNFYDTFLAERDPDYDPSRPVSFDLLSDAQPPHAEAHPDGGAIVRLYGDLKRHSMGRDFAEPDGPSAALTPLLAPTSTSDGQPVMVAPDVFLTAELWGVGNTGPWLHDGRAGTLREAALLHGEDAPPALGLPGRSEAQESRDAFVGLSGDAQSDLVAFLLSLRTYAPDER
jgi:hypothetical protein